MSDASRKFGEEVEILDYIRFAWKWKYLILAGTLICALGAALLTSLVPRVYRISMVLQPGIVGVDEKGNKLFMQSPDEIKAITKAEAFDREILNRIDRTNTQLALPSLKLKIDVPEESNVLRISYETSNVELGLQVLNSYKEVLLEKYSQTVDDFKNEYDRQIRIKKVEYDNQIRIKEAEIALNNAQTQLTSNQISEIQGLIRTLESEKKFIENSFDSLVHEWDKYASSAKNDEQILVALFYLNTLQRSTLGADRHMEKLHQQRTKIETLKEKLEKLYTQRTKLENEINAQRTKLMYEVNDLEHKKDTVQNLQIIREPRKNVSPIKPHKRLNVILGTMFGVFLMFMIAAFLESLKKSRKEINHPKLERKNMDHR